MNAGNDADTNRSAWLTKKCVRETGYALIQNSCHHMQSGTVTSDGNWSVLYLYNVVYNINLL